MSKKTVHEPEILEIHYLSLQQLCSSAQVEETVVVQLVEIEVLSPVADEANAWRFQADDLSRVRKANRLMQEFDLSPLGLALVIDLLDELETLRRLT